MADSKAPEIPKETPQPATAADPPAAVLPLWLTRLSRHPYACLALLGLLLWLPGIVSLPALDRDESRFAQSSRQMVESGNWVDIRFGQVPRYKKPVGIYWLQATTTELAGLVTGRDDQIWTYRLPSFFGGIIAAWLTVWCGLAVTGAEAALVAGLLMLGSVLLTAESTIATTDAVVLACALGMQGVLLRRYCAASGDQSLEPSGRLVLWGWAATAVGILVKFPVVPSVGIATILGLVAWDRKADWLSNLRPIRGMLLLLVLVCPWLIAIAIQSQGVFFEQSLGHDFAAKIAGGQESHGAWPGYYLLLSAACFWPTILFVPSGIVQGLLRRDRPGIRFLLVWALSWWAIVEIVPTKLPHYVIEAYPPLAILAAIFVVSPGASKWLALGRWIGIAQYAMGTVVFAAVLIVAPLYLGVGLHWQFLAAALVGASLALGGLAFAILRKEIVALFLALVAALVFTPSVTTLVGPQLQELWMSNRLKAMVTAASHPGDPPPAVAGYQEPSLMFALGKDIVLASGAGAADAGTRNGGLALIEDSEKGHFLARLAELQADATPVGELSGFNYSRGRMQHVTLYRVDQLHPLN